MRIISVLIVFCCICLSGYGQTNIPLLEKYRQMALEYNHDLKAAEKNIMASIELVKSAQDNLKPKFDGSANFQYIGNPMELSLNIPTVNDKIFFKGQNMQYGVAITLLQPVYTGGRVLELIKLSEQQQSLSKNTFDMVRSNVCFQTDIQYWNTVASIELTSLFNAYYQSIAKLKQIVKERVEIGIADPQDLLMVEVKLNNSQYQLLKSQNETQSNRMALNSLIGNKLDDLIEVDSLVVASIDTTYFSSIQSIERPEIKMATDNVNIQQSSLIINDAQYKPQFYVGAEGSYSSPGYNFKSDLNLNYAVYAKLTVPIFDWGKRRSDKRAFEHKIGIIKDNLNNIKDAIELEVEKSKMNLMQSIQRVDLTKNSLDKAYENEFKSIERYNEGRASVVDVIDAQVYKLTTEVNYVNAKLEMQVNFAEQVKALNGYCVK